MRGRGRISVLVTALLGSMVTLWDSSPVGGAIGDIVTVVGQVGVGDGGPATSAPLNQPAGLAVDASGNVYFADSFHHRVRMISSAGTITTIAGTNTHGYNGDNIPATSAKLYSPSAVAVHTSGTTTNVYIADTLNHRIRKVTITGGVVGNITTVAGDGTIGENCAFDVATSAHLNSPSGVAVNSLGILYISDTYNNCVRRVSGGNISVFAGNANGSSGNGGDSALPALAALNRPTGLAFDSSDNLYIVDTGNNKIRAISFGILYRVAGTGVAGASGDNGPATFAQLNEPMAIAVTSTGNILVAEVGNDKIRKFSIGSTITTVAGTGSEGYNNEGVATTRHFYDPSGIAIGPTGAIFVADKSNNKIRKFTLGGSTTLVAGNGAEGYAGDGGQATSAQVSYPNDLVVDSSSNIYVIDYGNNRIRKVAPNGVITNIAGNGFYGSAVDGGLATNSAFSYLADIAVDSAGNLYVVDMNDSTVWKITSASGVITRIAGTPGFNGGTGDGGLARNAWLNTPSAVAVDSLGNVFIADTNNNRVRKVASNGIISNFAGSSLGSSGASGDTGAATSARLLEPGGLAVDNSNNVYIADTGNHTVRKVNASDGKINRVAGIAQSSGFTGDGGNATAARLFNPVDVAIDSSGVVYIVDAWNNRVRKVSGGTITTIAGGDAYGYTGEGGPAVDAALNNVQGVAVDSYGNIYLADQFNHRVRKIVMYVAPSATTAPPVTAAPLVVPKKGGLPVKQLATNAGLTVPAGAKVSISVVGSSKKNCAVRGGKLVSLKSGTCRFTVTVKPKKGKSLKKTITLPAA